MYNIYIMTRKELDKFLKFLDKHNCWIFTIQTAELCFQEDPNTLRHGLSRHVKSGAITRLARGFYADLRSKAMPLYALEDMVKYLRPNEISYLSQESRLSELGIISQVPNRISVMTTGSSQVYHTPIGTIEITHTNRKLSYSSDCIKFDHHRKIFVASPKTALEDLRNAKRNMGLVDFEEYEIAQEEWLSSIDEDLKEDGRKDRPFGLRPPTKEEIPNWDNWDKWQAEGIFEKESPQE
jgi:hypothetical protein